MSTQPKPKPDWTSTDGNEIGYHGCHSPVKAAGFSAAQLWNAGFRYQELKEAGFAREQLREASYLVSFRP